MAHALKIARFCNPGQAAPAAKDKVPHKGISQGS